jgi:hypothetical protein
MIKQISKHNILVSPFTAVKAWELDNVLNQDVVLLEEFSSSVLIPDTEVALDYVDYTTLPLSINSNCNIALEQQDADGADYEEGISGSGLFNIESEERNMDGTYKRLIYDQTYRAFYNQYRNPTQIFGLDNIDFSLSNTNRVLSNEFLMFNIPRKIMGDKLVAGTIKMNDTTLDDNIEIYDDSYGNLIVGSNLFSKIQEVRSLSNSYFSGSSNNSCVTYTA